MGYERRIPLAEITPTEVGFSEVKLAGLYVSAQQGRIALPVPVRETSNGFAHLDGRHRLLYSGLTGKQEITCYVVESKGDFPTKQEYPDAPILALSSQKDCIERRWGYASWLSREVGGFFYPEYFAALQKIKPQLASYATCQEFLRKQFPRIGL